MDGGQPTTGFRPPSDSFRYCTQKILVKPRVMCELGMETRGEQIALLRGDDRAVLQFRQDLDTITDGFHQRRANKNRVERSSITIVDGGYIEVGLERVYLASKGITFDRYIHYTDERLPHSGMTCHSNIFCQNDHPRARSPYGLALRDHFPNRFDETILRRQLADGRAFAAGNNQAIELAQLFG